MTAERLLELSVTFPMGSAVLTCLKVFNLQSSLPAIKRKRDKRLAARLWREFII